LTSEGRFGLNQQIVTGLEPLNGGEGHKYGRLTREVSMATPVTVPMVGKIVSVSVKVGDRVEENDQVAVMEAMKMEMPLVAPVSGVVKEVLVLAGQEVEAEATIAIIE
jgi:acetyl-CoA carboxylase biotin carboxyl carrier protein